MTISRSLGKRSLTIRPPMLISPSLTTSSPAIILSRVDLPQPEGPTSTTNSPSSMSTLTPGITWTVPHLLTTFPTLTSANVGPPLLRHCDLHLHIALWRGGSNFERADAVVELECSGDQRLKVDSAG